MAKYEGVILTETESLTLETRVFNAVKLILSSGLNEVELKTRVFNAEKVELFLNNSTNADDVVGKKINRLKGHMISGEDNLPPRRYPLENPWNRSKT